MLFANVHHSHTILRKLAWLMDLTVPRGSLTTSSSTVRMRFKQRLKFIMVLVVERFRCRPSIWKKICNDGSRCGGVWSGFVDGGKAFGPSPKMRPVRPRIRLFAYQILGPSRTRPNHRTAPTSRTICAKLTKSLQLPFLSRTISNPRLNWPSSTLFTEFFHDRTGFWRIFCHFWTFLYFT